jgi:hypothetical protein
MSLRQLGTPTLEDALAYLDRLTEQKPEKLGRAAVRWHGRLETKAPLLTLAESQLAIAAQRVSSPGSRRLSRCCGGCQAYTAVARAASPLEGAEPTETKAWLMPFLSHTKGGVERMLLLVLLAVLALVLFGLGFTLHWLFIIAVIAALLFVISLFMGAAGGRTRGSWW